MSELSNAVTVLIARMESHPEDFDLHNVGLYSSTKFGDVAGALYGLVGMDAGKAGAYWFLSDADKEALIEAWKKYHRTAMEKEVMGKIFDDGSEERDRKAAYISGMKASMQRQVQAAQNLHPAQNAAQGMAIQGSSYNGGLLGQAQGMTVRSNGAVEMTNTLSLGGETIDSSILKKLKDLVK